MNNWNEIRESFKFLNDFNFKGPIIYSNGVEMNFDYISRYSVINITYEPGYEFFPRFIKFKTELNTPELEKIRWRKLKTTEYKIYDLALFLDPKNEIKDSIKIKNQGDKNIAYFSQLPKTNQRILENNFNDFRIGNMILKWLN